MSNDAGHATQVVIVASKAKNSSLDDGKKGIFLSASSAAAAAGA